MRTGFKKQLNWPKIEDAHILRNYFNKQECGIFTTFKRHNARDKIKEKHSYMEASWVEVGESSF